MPEKSAKSEFRQNNDFVSEGLSAFEREIFEPILQRAHESPAEARRLIAAVRAKLEPLDKLLARIPNGSDGRIGANGRDGSRVVDIEGARETRLMDSPVREAAHELEGIDDIGRNQRSRLRELTLLEFMAQDTRAYSLQQLMTALSARGFHDSSAAVVSQLHRLKQSSVINQPANGMYEITDGGLGHLRHLRSSFGALLNDGR